MNESVLIVSLPQSPLSFDLLRPCSDAAQLAAALSASGVRIRIADMGSLERLPDLLSRPVLEALPAPKHDASIPAIDFSTHNLARAYHAAVLAGLRREMTHSQPRTVVFLARTPFEARVARSIAGDLKLRNAATVFNRSLEALGGTPQPPDWLTEALRAATAPRETYSPDIYPVLQQETKVRVFTIGSDRHTCDSVSGLFTILEETAALNRYYGARAFHFGRSVAGNRLYHLASELVTRNSRFRYSVHAAMDEYPLELAAVAAASGCIASSFDVGSGSQRLLDRYFEHAFKLHTAERTIRSCCECGIHTRVELRYPCELDDFHTRDETVRFIGRSLPHAVHVAGPPSASAPHPATLWKPAERRRRNLENTLRRLGVAPDVRPIDALLASLAGFAGRETQFRNHVARTMAAGNIDALANVVETINAAALGRPDTMFWKSLGPDQRMVGN